MAGDSPRRCSPGVEWEFDGDAYSWTFGHFTVRVSRTVDGGYAVEAAGLKLRRLSPDVPDGQRRAVATLRRMLTEALSELPTEPDRSIRMDADDVTVEAIEPVRCDGCGERPVTHRVMLDMRGAGISSAVEEMCQACAASLALTIRASLPPAKPAGGTE